MSDHFDGKRFFNPNGPDSEGLLSVLKWKLNFSGKSWPSKSDQDVVFFKPKLKEEDKLIVTFINHVTFLIQVDGLNILTDPVYSDRTSPVSFIGPKAIHPPGIKFEDLPPIDLVLISHNHYDHMDAQTVKKLEEKFHPHFVTPLENAFLLESFGAKKITELDWWESLEIQNNVKVTLTPAQHWSSRTPFDRSKSLWGGYYIETKSKKIYFAGDTGYSKHFIEINKKLGKPNLSLLPIGAYEPRWFMKSMHMNPEDAVLAHLDLQSEMSLGMHFGTFPLTDEAVDTPVQDLMMAKEKLRVQNFIAPKPGESFQY